MWLYALRRLVMTIPILIGVTIICFALIHLAPGDPIRNMLPPDATDAQADALRAVYGLDKPLPIQAKTIVGAERNGGGIVVLRQGLSAA